MDHDAFVALDSFATRLQQLHLKFAYADLLLVGRVWACGGQVDIEDFRQQYHHWLQQRADANDCVDVVDEVAQNLNDRFDSLAAGTPDRKPGLASDATPGR